MKINSCVRRSVDRFQRRSCAIRRDFTVLFADPSINHSDIDAFANGHGIAFLLRPDCALDDAADSDFHEISIDNIVGECVAQLDAQFHDAYLIVEGVTCIELSDISQDNFRRHLRRWVARNALPMDPVIWRLAGRYPPWERTFARAWPLLESEEFLRQCNRPRRRFEPRTVTVPFVGVMNIDAINHPNRS